MLIPEKKTNRLVSIKTVTVTIIILSVLALVWGRIDLYSTETVVSHEDLIIATVEKGDLICEVRAPGTIVPVELTILAASSRGRVEEILHHAGDSVDVGMVILTLDNPELTEAVDSVKYDLKLQQAAYSVLEQRLRQETLTQRITVADFKARYEMAKLRKQANQRLVKTGAVSNINYNESILLVEQLNIQYGLEIERLQSLPALRQSELAVAQAKIQKVTRQLELQEKLVDGLSVKSSTKGILQEVLLKEGQQVIVVVDVYFTDNMLEGARPDLRIDGVIELEHLRNVSKK
jgi:HlyD family secretion protein